MFGVFWIEFRTFQKLAGALHVKGAALTRADMKNIVLFGKAYGPQPTYGENMYQFRMSYRGYHNREFRTQKNWNEEIYSKVPHMW